MIRTYSELMRIKGIKNRYKYLKLSGRVGEITFGHDRYLNQVLYTSDTWRNLRDEIIIRDEGCDLACPDFEIYGRIYIHHLNPITIKDIETRHPKLFDPRNLICTSYNTHIAIHYSNESMLPELPIKRTKYDTCPWKGGKL